MNYGENHNGEIGLFCISLQSQTLYMFIMKKEGDTFFLILQILCEQKDFLFKFFKNKWVQDTLVK